MSAPNNAGGMNYAIISYTTVLKETGDGKTYVRVPNVDHVEVAFTEPGSHEAREIHKARRNKNSTAGDLIQLYSTDHFPVDTRDLRKIKHSMWDVTDRGNGLADVKITCDLSAYRK